MKALYFFLLLFLFLAQFSLFPQETSNITLNALRCSKPITIDADLKEWDFSTSIPSCYDLSTLKNTHAVQTMAMYDENYLYFAFRYKDKTPLVNAIDPVFDPQGGWKSDATQIRLKTPDKIIHFTIWYYTPKQLPWVSIHIGLWNPNESPYEDIQDGKKLGIKVAFKKSEHNDGYDEEIAIPWELLQKIKPWVHEKLKCGLEFFWGRENGKDWPEHRFADLINPEKPKREFFWTDPDSWGSLELSDSTHLYSKASILESKIDSVEFNPYPTTGKYPIHYTLEQDQHVTLVIEDSTGRRIRNLIADVPRKKGENTDYWDGKDDLGNEVPSGKYVVRGLCHRPFHLAYQFAFGNPGDPQWLIPDGKGGWLSNHENPFALAVDDQYVYIAAATAEGACTVMALDFEGKKQWGIGGINGGMITRMGPYLYMVVEGCLSSYGVPPGELRLYRYKAKDGTPIPFSNNSPYQIIGHFDAQKPPPLKERLGKAYEEGRLDADWAQKQAIGFTSDESYLYCSLYFEDKILVVDEEGHFIREIPVKKPAGIASNKKGELFIISDKKVYRWNENKGFIPLIESGLSAPIGIALDKDERIYVSEWGKAMNIKVFSKEGKPLSSIGKKGGRNASGIYNPETMFFPWCLGIDPMGNLWVAEWDNAPRRISVWSKEGKIINEFCGSTYYAGEGCIIDPKNPTFGIVMGNGVELDWNKGLWRVISVLWRELKSNALFGPLAGGLAGEGIIQRIVTYNSKKWLISGMQNYACISELTDHYTAKPKVALGTIGYFLSDNCLLPEVIEKNLFFESSALNWAKKTFPCLFFGEGWGKTQIGNFYGRDQIWSLFQFESNQKGYRLNNTFLWIDQDGDGLVEENELALLHQSLEDPLFKGAWWMPIFSQDLSLYWFSVDKNDQLTGWSLPCYGLNDVGSPVYYLNKRKKIFTYQNSKKGYDPPEGWCDSKGNILVITDPLMMFSPEGKLLWQYPDPWPGVHGSHYSAQSYPGRLIGPLYVLGSADGGKDIGEIFCLAGNLGERYLFTTDGLFIGSLFKDCRSAPDVLPQVPYRNMLIDSTSAGGESFGGQFFKNPADGQYYLIGPVSDGRECVIVAKIQGMETIKKMVLSPIVVDYESQGTLEDKNKKENNFPTLSIKFLSEPAFGIPSKNIFPWDSPHSAASIFFDKTHSALATWVFDKDYIYIGFKNVLDDSPMINRGIDPTKLFKTGDAVVFDIRTKNENSKNTNEVEEGDIRLLFSVFQEKPIAILYRYKKEGATNPVAFASPIGVTKVDEVVQLKDAKILLEKDQKAYSLYASIPLKDINFSPKTGTVYRGDFGVIYSDKSGQNDVLRMFWSNKTTGMVNDLSIEAAINPSSWGFFSIER
ncbi:hypothetical protein IT6_09485 [Methylacidiphilum caldifontis]|uniref:FlgD immunoglobulin-like domain containing protein n=1 Tax=Methylacidiphilum caldifontis TaxID=2795386 RepID=UPI001A8D3719|nr:FlgD immunoglobulin-like domain containing protein [Methylacidiphilum caldifontis]QSR88581.1 hypothetical protein IT6_09485 [Methylacidiphilum caldifontis]